MNDEELTAEMLHDENQQMRDAISEIYCLASELYAERGEDDRTAEICNKLMGVSKRWALRVL